MSRCTQSARPASRPPRARPFAAPRSFAPVQTHAPPAVQASLRVSRPGDAAEREADRVADTVLRMPAPEVQRMCADCEEELQRQAKPQAGTSSTAAPLVGLGAGQPLPAAERAYFEPRFGFDFGQVRIHAGERAAATAAAYDARAFTLGRDVVFGAGEYAPGSADGRRLLAHELTHVVQQRQGTAIASVQRQDAPAGQTVTAEQQALAAPYVYDLLDLAASPGTIGMFKAAAEAIAAEALSLVGADAIVFSLSAAVGSPYIVGGEAGFEAVYSPSFGWATYFQAGVGAATVGWEGTLAAGIVWGLKGPQQYTESFVELSGSAGEFGASGFFSPVSGTPFGIKAGYSVGPGVNAVFIEWYWQLTGMESGRPDVAYNGYYTYYLPTLLGLGVTDGFAVQFHQPDPESSAVSLKILFRKTDRLNEVVFSLGPQDALPPNLEKVGPNDALFDLDGDGEADLTVHADVFFKVPEQPVLRVDYRNSTLMRLDVGTLWGRLSTGRQYYLVPGTESIPGGPLFVDEQGRSVNPARP